MGKVKGEGSSISGPPDMSSIDWSLPHHQRSVAACLVQATYLLEKDRQDKSDEPDALARPWYESRNFKLKEKLIDDSDSSIFGAIYESIQPPVQDNGNAPKFVIAFRGTLLEQETMIRDIKLDLLIAIGELRSSSRCKNAVKSAREIVAAAGAENVWIAGHSLGAAIAINAGRSLALAGSNVTTFLFNLPLLTSSDVGWPILNDFFDIARYFLLRITGHKPSEAFARLSSWVPNILVNPRDLICSDNINHFQNRVNMRKLWLWKLAARGSYLDWSSHRLPSANLTENRIERGPLNAHGINQWFDPCADMPSEEYLYGGGGNNPRPDSGRIWSWPLEVLKGCIRVDVCRLRYPICGLTVTSLDVID